MRLLTIFCVFACCSIAAAAEKNPAQPHARNVVLVVWDGMHQQFVDEENTPTLWKLVLEGVIFREHHAVYPTSTEVNGVAIATGVYPRRSGVMGNWEYRPEIDAQKPVSRETPEAFGKGDELTGGNYIALPTLAERVQAAGHRTAIAGTKWGTVLQDRRTHRESPAAQASTVFFGKGTVPENAFASLTETLGPFPEKLQHPNEHQDSWTTEALTQVLWREGVPRFSLLWLGEPDFTQHFTAPGSPEALGAIKNSDARLAAVLQALDAKGVRESTDVIVVSDHGFSTVERTIDVVELLKSAGFNAAKEFAGEPQPGQIMVVGNGGTAFFYVIGRDDGITARLIEWLQLSDFAGVIFSRTPVEGTFPLADVQIDTSGAPDVVMSFRWNDRANEFGARGLIHADWKRGSGKGTHATISKFDMHNTLIAAGPDFRRGFVDEWPTGNIDLAPTVLHILGIKSAEPLDGRVLHEALVNTDTSPPKPQTTRVEAAREVAAGRWQQYLQISRVGDTIYLDEGNGGFIAAAKKR